ncbi:serine/threonine-protein kinase [Sorangium sp. So ce327]|uniref:serine/threonine-protein kinase n=1 Tax=Sorangium sp. So ce327 TaxID=3133301 RepID=UPI003F5E7488
MTSLSSSASASATALPTTGSDNSTPKVCPTCGVRYPAEFRVCPRDAATLDESEDDAVRDDLVGKTLNETYTVVRVVGEGGMGRVYEARHTRISSKRFAIKMLHPEFARQPQVISRFQREAEAAAAVQSPYVVTVFDVHRTAEGRPFLVNEFLEGKELADYLNEAGKMKTGPAVRIVRQICKALAAAHAKGVVHRDMKPENVFLTGDLAMPTAKVIDFGISKVDDAPGAALTQTGMIMGTPSYMAPEQARGERVDHRADIYAVGAILYCALTGSRPFDRNDPTATLTAVLTEDPPRPRSLEPSIPEPLEMIIQRAMAKEPSHRYQTMEELDAELALYDTSEAEPKELDAPGSPGPRVSMPSAPRVAPTMQLRQAQQVSMARPLILLLFALGLFWVAGSLVTLVTAIIRLSRGGQVTDNLTGLEAVLLASGIGFALITPALISASHVRKTVWNNSMKAVDLADNLRRPIVVGLCAYGFASLLVRVVEAVVLRRAAGVAWPMWDVVLFAVGAVGAAGAYLLLRSESR